MNQLYNSFSLFIVYNILNALYNSAYQFENVINVINL